MCTIVSAASPKLNLVHGSEAETGKLRQMFGITDRQTDMHMDPHTHHMHRGMN